MIALISGKIVYKGISHVIVDVHGHFRADAAYGDHQLKEISFLIRVKTK